MKTWIQRTIVASAAIVVAGSLVACSSGFANEAAAAAGQGDHGQHGPHSTMADGGMHGEMHSEMHGGMHGSMHDQSHMTKRQGKMLERVASRLDLDDAQKQKLAALAAQMQSQRQAMMGGMKPARDEMLSLLSGPTFDQARAQALVQEKTQQVQAQAPQLIAAMADFYDSLRPEQQAKVREFAQSRAERADERHQGGHHGKHHGS